MNRTVSMSLVLCFCSTNQSFAQEDVKFPVAERSTIGRICLVASVDHEASLHPGTVSVYEDSSGKFVEIGGAQVPIEEYSRLRSEAVPRLQKTLDLNGELLLKTIRWPFVAWRDARSSIIVTELDSEARKIWEAKRPLEQKLLQLDQKLEKDACGALLVIWEYNLAGMGETSFIAGSVPMAYAGLRATAFRAKTHDVVYRRLQFTEKVALAEPDFAAKFNSAIARALPKFYEDIVGYELPDVFRASEKGKTDEIRALLDAGVDVNMRDKGWRTALYRAADADRLEVVRMLVTAGAVGVGNAPELEIKLRKAAEDGEKEKVQTLIKAGVNLNSTDVKGCTALYKAVEKRRLDVLKMLLEAGALVNVRSNDGKTALDVARQGKNQDVIRMLEAH